MKLIPLLIVIAALGTMNEHNAVAQDSGNNASAASRHASKAAVLGMTASGQAAVGVSAAALVISGATATAIGSAATEVGNASGAAASGRPGQPLPITEETISVISPAEALKSPPTSRAR